MAEEEQSNIQRMLEEGESEEDIQFSSEDIAREWKQTKKRTESKWMMGIYGREGTCKSGVLLDLRTEEELEDDTKIVIIDIDESCRPLWESYWDCDENIRIFDPVVSVGKGTERDISYIASYRKVIAILGWLEENIDKYNIKYVAIDGIDTFLKWCEHVMKDVDMGNIDVHNSDVGWNWGKRNKRYYRVLNWLKRLPVASFVTAHLDTREDIETGKEEISGANWHNGTRQDTADELYQIIRTKKREEQRGNYKVKTFFAEVEKWKGNINMEARKFKVLENKVDLSNNSAESEWEGLVNKIRNYNEKDKNQEEKETKETTTSSSSIIDEATGETIPDDSTDKKESSTIETDELLESDESNEDDEFDEEKSETKEETTEEQSEEEQNDSQSKENENVEEETDSSSESEEESQEDEDDGDDDWLDNF